MARLTGASGRTLIFDDGTMLALPHSCRVEDKGTVFLIATTRGRLTHVGSMPTGASRADVERYVWQTLDALNRAGWWHQG